MRKVPALAKDTKQGLEAGSWSRIPAHDNPASRISVNFIPITLLFPQYLVSCQKFGETRFLIFCQILYTEENLRFLESRTVFGHIRDTKNTLPHSRVLTI